MTHCFSSQASSWNESVTIWKRSFLSFEWLSQGRCSCVVPPATFSCLFTLGMASPQQKAFRVLEFAKTNSVVTVQRAFRRRFDINPPSPKNIRRWFRQFQESGCLFKGKCPGRPRVSEEQVVRIRATFEGSPRKSKNRASRELAITQSTIWRVLRRRLNLKPYRLHLVQALTNDDKRNRMELCDSMFWCCPCCRWWPHWTLVRQEIKVDNE